MQSDFWSEAYPVLPFSDGDVGHAALAAALAVAVLVVVLLAVTTAVLRRRRRRSAGPGNGLVGGGPTGRPTPPRG